MSLASLLLMTCVHVLSDHTNNYYTGQFILPGQYNWQQVKALPALCAPSVPSYNIKIITLPFCQVPAAPSSVSKYVPCVN